MKETRDHFNLLCGIGELVDLMSANQDIDGFLRDAAAMVARHLNSDVCSIYLYDETTNELVLTATKGLNPRAVGKIRMKPGEGLVGTTFQKMKPIREGHVSQSSQFKYFKEAHEDGFESFLSVPLQRGVEKIGVLVVQHSKDDFFDQTDLMALRASASQLAAAIENARLMMTCAVPPPKETPSLVTTEYQMLRCSPASKGYAFAPATVFKRSHGQLIYDPPQTDRQWTLNDFHHAVQKTKNQLKEFQFRLAEKLPESASFIFTAHFMILKDAKFTGKIIEHIQKGMSPPQAVIQTAKHYIDLFSTSPHPYIREKANDMVDLTGRILKNMYRVSDSETEVSSGSIVIARELHPSEVLRFATEGVSGIILVSGGITSHVAILSRSLSIPLVIANYPDLLNLPDGTPVIVDAEIGNVYIRPTTDIIRNFDEQHRIRSHLARQPYTMEPETRTLDGHRIRLYANINLLSELDLAKQLQAEGIGLYRTEFPFLIRSMFPSEEEQYLIYKRLFDVMADRPVTIRTLDVGGDKVLMYAKSLPGNNPELGLKSIRFSFHHRAIFKQQIRAILRAAVDAPQVRIMFPMIASVDDFLEARKTTMECMDDLQRQGIDFHEHPQMGAMLEVPSVLEIIEDLAQVADFFSIGSNDFIQYLLAVDRNNEAVARYYTPYHPSVLRGIHKMVRSVVAFDRDINVCGEIAHEPEFIPFLIGVGVRVLSVNPRFLAPVQKQISSLRLDRAQRYASELLAESRIVRIQEMVRHAPAGIR